MVGTSAGLFIWNKFGKNFAHNAPAAPQDEFSEQLTFIEPEKPDDYTEKIRNRFHPINKIKNSNSDHKPEDPKKSSNKEPNYRKYQLPSPKKYISPRNVLSFKWNSKRNIGPGLLNLNNTCFMNSVLQILSYTPPLWQYLMNGNHSNECNSSGFCAICQLANLFKQMDNSENNNPISPNNIFYNLKSVRSYFKPGRQEDAHEFLRAYIEAMQKQFMHGHEKLDRYSQETTIINHIFGGWFRSTVECCSCGHHSVTFDPLLEINLDIAKCNSIESALNLYCSPDFISGKKYKCDNCKMDVDAKKIVLVEKHPKILTIQLKRFNYSSIFNTKINKQIEIPEKLEFTPYIYNAGNKITYSLYGVIVHMGGSCNSGHYYAYAKSSLGMWCELNDSYVNCVSINRVLSGDAYLLFYIENDSEHLSPSVHKFNHEIKNTKNEIKNELSNNVEKVTHNDNNSFTKYPEVSNEQKEFQKENKSENNRNSNIVPVAYWNEKNKVNIIPKSERKDFPKSEHILNLGNSVKSWDETSNHIDSCVILPSPKTIHPLDIENDKGRKRKFKPKPHFSTFIYRQNPFQTIHNKIFSKHRNRYRARTNISAEK